MSTHAITAPITAVTASTYRVPLNRPESDGTITWRAVVVTVAKVEAAGIHGIGYSFGAGGTADIVNEYLSEAVVGVDAMDPDVAWKTMIPALRQPGRLGIGSLALSAVDTAVWDLKARLLGIPLTQLLGPVCSEVPIYASGGFTTMAEDDLYRTFAGYVGHLGVTRVKMKVGINHGTDPVLDIRRVAVVREAIGDDVELFVDAAGSYPRNTALYLCPALAELGVTWFEDPVDDSDFEGLDMIKESTDIDVSAGGWALDPSEAERLIPHVDVLAADVSRIGGFTEWHRLVTYAERAGRQLSTHGAQSLHSSVACASLNVRHVEYYADHAKAEHALFEGLPDPKGGTLAPNSTRPGSGIALKTADLETFAA